MKRYAIDELTTFMDLMRSAAKGETVEVDMSCLEVDFKKLTTEEQIKKDEVDRFWDECHEAAEELSLQQSELEEGVEVKDYFNEPKDVVICNKDIDINKLLEENKRLLNEKDQNKYLKDELGRVKQERADALEEVMFTASDIHQYKQAMKANELHLKTAIKEKTDLERELKQERTAHADALDNLKKSLASEDCLRSNEEYLRKKYEECGYDLRNQLHANQQIGNECNRLRMENKNLMEKISNLQNALDDKN